MTSLTPDLAGWLMALFLLFFIIRKYDVSFYLKNWNLFQNITELFYFVFE